MSVHKDSSLQITFIFLSLVVAVLLASNCRAKNSSEKDRISGETLPPAEKRVILQVGEDLFYDQDFLRYVREMTGNEADALAAITLSRLFDKYVEEKLLLLAAKKKGVALSPAEKQEYLATLDDATLTEQEKASFLESDSGLLVDKFLVEKYIRHLVRDVTVPEDEVRRYYDLKKSEFYLPERVKVSQVLLQSEAEAVEAWDKLRTVAEDGFRELAKSESLGPEAAEGGEMGIFQRGQLPPEIENAVFSLQEGEISPVVESSYGFHIFRLDKKFEPEWISFEEAAASIKLKILEQKVQAALSRHFVELKESFSWKVFFEDLPFPYQRNDE